MRSFKSGLFTFTIAGIVGMAAVFGCSAEGAGDVIEDQSQTEPEDESSSGNTLPPSDPGTSSSGSSSGSTTKDAGKDATKTDAAKDAGPPPPAPGDTCTVVDKVYTKSCGKCGKQEAICLDQGAGVLKVSDYSACAAETGVCVPGETTTEACGNCGTLTKTCNNYCAWTSSACGGQPTNSCSPGAVEYASAGCTVANTYRNRTCAAACTWNTFSTACAEPNNPIKLTLAGTAGGTATGTYTLANTKMGKRQPLYTCGSSASLSSTNDYPYELVELVNTSGKQLTIKVKSATASTFDVAYAIYPTNLPPTTDAELKSCAVADYMNYDTTTTTMPAGAKFLLRISSYYAVSNTFGDATTGSVPVTVTTTAAN
jgi:hypothetical protein